MSPDATQTSDADPPAGSPAAATSRFAYASGAKPLEGYTIKRGIGHGGFGEVYFATSDAGKEVALKLIRRNLDIELRGVTQCLNLKHPNLLSLYDVRQDNHGDTWVVMELMTGQSLEELLARNPDGLPADEALAWMHGIAAGVAYLHDHGIVHRDLKPGNIFVDEGIVKIGDYGLSKFISCSRRSGQTGSVGTVHYMAPEIANGRYGKEIDIYALGIILYEMLTGHVPFEGESVGEILMKHLTAEPDVSRVAEPYRTIVARALAKDPAKRFASVNELIALLPPAPVGPAARFAGPNAAIANATNATRVAPEAERADPHGFSLAPEVDHSTNHSEAEEPIAQWVRATWTDLSAWWERKNFQPLQKLLVLSGGIFLALNLAPLWAPTLAVAALAYWIYRAVRALAINREIPKSTIVALVMFVGIGALFLDHAHYSFGGGASRFSLKGVAVVCLIVLLVLRMRGMRGSNSAAHQSSRTAPDAKLARAPVASAAPPQESPTRRRWRFQTTQLYQPGPPRRRLMQLVGSLLLSAIVCPVLALVVLILRAQPLEPNQFAWLATTSVLGSWAVLIPSKFWEGRIGDAAWRRFVMLVTGMLFGAAAYGMVNWLIVSLPYDERLTMATRWDLQHTFFAADGSPLLPAYLAYFGFLFVLPRWWLQANPVRDTRLSIWYTAVAVFWAWVPAVFFWPFPQPWGLMLAAIMAISVQLASPWVPKDQRQNMLVRPGEA